MQWPATGISQGSVQLPVVDCSSIVFQVVHDGYGTIDPFVTVLHRTDDVEQRSLLSARKGVKHPLAFFVLGEKLRQLERQARQPPDERRSEQDDGQCRGVGQLEADVEQAGRTCSRPSPR